MAGETSGKPKQTHRDTPASERDDAGAAAVPAASRSGQPYLFEVSSEVCRQIGGIYQVVRSKAPTMVSRWQDRYALVGAYDAASAEAEFEPARPGGWLRRVIDRAAEDGLRVHHGRWLVSGRPRVLLLESETSAERLAQLKYQLWKDHGIESVRADWWMDNAVRLADGVRRLAAAATDVAGRGAPSRVVVHAHEWLGGLALPMIRHAKLSVATVFTTHATLLGRYLASNRELAYDRLDGSDDEAIADRYNVTPEHRIEKACAHAAHVMTTVSPITGEECSHLLKRPADVILPNGINPERYDVGPDFHAMHARFKERIHRFVMGHFFPSYSFDLDRTLYMFTSGRFEPTNKGFDLCLEAMARLNAQLKDFDLGVTVVFFLISNRPVHSILPEALHSQGVLRELREVCDQVVAEAGEQLFPRAASGAPGDVGALLAGLVGDYWRLRYRRTQQAFRNRTGLPPIVTHQLEDDANDPVLQHMRHLGLFNRAEDPVKVVYHPQFIAPENPLWGIEYDQFVRGCHMGVFPSAYEPWGYTPLECVAMGVPAITSNLAGFGAHVAEKLPDHDKWGVNVLKRRGSSFNDSAADLARWLLAFCRLDRRGRIDLRNAVERRAADFGWSRLAGAYHRAHDLAVERAEADFAPRSKRRGASDA
ncbi:MAG: glycogen/starch synthase [Planctomycetota bacterium]